MRGMSQRTRLESIALIAILLLAAYLRLGFPAVIEFKSDEAYLSRLALDLVRGRHFPLLGMPSSVGLPNPPMAVYLMAVPFSLSSHPLIATQLIGLFNVLSVAMLYSLTRRYFGAGPAILAAALYAAMPWAVLFSRKIWAQDLLPPLVIACVWSGLSAFYEGRRGAQRIHLPLLAITGQVHYVAVVLVPISLYLIVTGRRKLTRAFLWSILIAFALTLPYLVGLYQAGLANIDAIRARLGEVRASEGAPDSPPPLVSTDGLSLAYLAISGTDIHALAGPQQFQAYVSSVPNAYLAFHGVAILSIAGAIGWVIAAFNRRQRVVLITLLLWLCVTPLAFSFRWTPPYIHYFIPILPAAAVSAAMAIQWLLQQVARLVNARLAVGIAATGVIVLLGLQTLMLNVLYQFLNTHETPDGFGTPLSYLLPVREALSQESGVLIDLDGQFLETAREASVWYVLLYDLPNVRLLDASIKAFPKPSQSILREGCNTPETFTLRKPLNGTQQSCYGVEHTASMPDKLSVPSTSAHFENGIAMVGYSWQTGCLTAYWQPLAAHAASAELYQVAVQLINADGSTLGNLDRPFWLTRHWRDGEPFSQQYCLATDDPRLANLSAIRIGLYTYQDTPEGRQFFNVSVLDEQNNPTGQFVELPIQR